MDFLLDYEEKYWNDIYARLKNEYGTAGLMGNLKKESGLIPYRKQGDMTPPYVASQEYTNSVDNGTISKDTFCNDSIGYGLAQWTFHTRKQQLYSFHTEMAVSIGSYELSLKMLFFELDTGYTDVRDYLRTATSVRGASDYVLHNYEQPDDQSEAEEVERYQLSQQIYDKYHGTEPVPESNIRPIPIWMYSRKRRIR